MDNLRSMKPSPLKENFKKYGDTFELITKNESNRMYCYRRTTSEGTVYFEVFRSNLYKDENEKIYECYPSTSQFGISAWCIRDNEHAQKKIQKYM